MPTPIAQSGRHVLRPSPESPVLQLRDLHTEIGGRPVHRGLNLAVERGEILGIIGNSGSGKSLLLKSIKGLLPPVEGSVRVFDIDVYAASREERQLVARRCGVLFQHDALFSMRTIGQNVEVPLRELIGLPDRLAAELAQLKIAMAGLSSDAASQYPSELSGGMQKRAGLARAVATDPELLLLDEPTTGLDVIMADQIDGLIRALARLLGMTVVLVTHDVDTLFGVCDRVAALVDGRIAALCRPPELLASDNPWVEKFLAARRKKYT